MDVANGLKHLRVVVVVSALVILVAMNAPGTLSGAPNAATVRESNDFATRVLRDPWDMSEFADISAALNNSAQNNYLQNYQVQNGIFSAQTISDGQFYLLFPGYRINPSTSAVNVGKYGANYPIAANYSCLYIAMQVNSSSPGASQVFWFADTHLNDGTSPWGFSKGFANSASIWKLYSINLADSSNAGGGSSWTSNATWRGLRFDPTTTANAAFAIDWARLTDCSAVNTTISWTASATSLWLTSASTGNSILVKTGLSGTSTSLDTQGLAAGTYQVCLSTSLNSCNTSGTPTPGSLTIEPAPIVTFDRPSPTSGSDYATQAGNPWDFSDAADVAQTMGIINPSVSGGVLNMWTASGDPNWGADPIIFLNAPQLIANGSQYRYLSYRLYTQWPLQNAPKGMIVRWSWKTSGCEVITHDIPFDVGWQTYSVDLSDPFNGSVEPSGCAPGITWGTSANITRLRFDPNENILGQTLFQQLDWIRLTEVDKVTHGTPFPIQISLNKPPQGITFTYYYTTDRQQPTQHVAVQYTASAPPPAGSHRLYLPLTMNSASLVAGGLTFLWNTTSVVPGTYYVCVSANDTLNQAIYCSDAPVQVN